MQINSEYLTFASPLAKGYADERRFFLNLALHNINLDNLECNDYSSYEAYCRSIGKGADFRLSVNGKVLEIEKKYLKARCYRSWILRDYIPRFTYSNDSIPIIVVTNKWSISYAGRQLLKEWHVKVFSDDEFMYC